MEEVVPRYIKPVEATRLGIQDGWYGNKVNGTLMTERFADLEACELQIKKMSAAAAK